MAPPEPHRAASLRPSELLFVSAFLGLALLVGGVFLALHLSEHRARVALLEVVARSSGARLNGRPVEDPAPLLRALRATVRVPSHQSAPTAPIRVELTGDGETAIVLARDSTRPSEFWVFRPGSNWHGDPLGQEAGRITSDELDAYLRAQGL